MGYHAADTKSTVRILLVEDHAIIRLGIKLLLEQQIQARKIVCGEAGDAREAMDMLTSQRWDLMLLDITLPGRSGLDFLSDIVKAYPAMPVLVVSMHPEDPFAVLSFRAGAAGYISKNASPAELVGAVEKVLAGGRYINNGYGEALIKLLSAHSTALAHLQLSSRELEVLRMLGAGKRISDIAKILSLSIKTISTYRSHLLRKLNLRTNGELVRYALEQKLV